MNLVSHVEGDSVLSITWLVIGSGSDKVDFLRAFLDVEVNNQIAGVAIDADLIAGHIAALPDGSSEHTIRPFFDDVLVVVGKVGVAGTIGFGQVLNAVPKCVQPGLVPNERMDGWFEILRHFDVLESKDDGEIVCRRVRLILPREDHIDFHHASSVYGPKAGQQAHKGPERRGDETHREDKFRKLKRDELGMF